MKVSLSPLQLELREHAREFLTTVPDPTWSQLAGLGWTGVDVSEELGGAGMSLLEEAIIMEETGRALLRGPLWSTAVVRPFLPAQEQSRIAEGKVSWTVVLGALVADLDTANSVAELDGAMLRERIDGERRLRRTVDETRPLGVVTGGRPGTVLATGDELGASLRARGMILLGFEAIGVGKRALQLSVEYASSREQFGRRIGSFQAVAHPLADAYVELELAESLAWWAAWAMSNDTADRGIAVAAAKHAASDAAVNACERAIQAHGGIGFTWEHPLHRYYKRALWIRSWGTPPPGPHADIAASLLDDGAHELSLAAGHR